MDLLTLVSEKGEITTQPVLWHDRIHKPVSLLTSRQIFAAVHVVPKVQADNSPGRAADIDWDSTLKFRHHIWSWGLGVADAMDTAQRNMGLDSLATRELIRRSAEEAKSVGAPLVVGVNTDHILEESISLAAVIDAYVEQLEQAQEQGVGVVLMASRHLARAASSSDDYERVYQAVLERATKPVILHWLGAAFDPNLSNYFGSNNSATASITLLRIIQSNEKSIAGIKMSLLDENAEVELRAQLPSRVRMLTGDDLNYVDLIAGDGEHHSDALLGAFAAIGPLASSAIQELDAGNEFNYRKILEPTQALSRHIFEAPTWFYKSGIAFLSWLNGHQVGFVMVGGLQAARSLPHLSKLVELANLCGALEQPDLAIERWNRLLAVYGISPKRSKV